MASDSETDVESVESVEDENIIHEEEAIEEEEEVVEEDFMEEEDIVEGEEDLGEEEEEDFAGGGEEDEEDLLGGGDGDDEEIGDGEEEDDDVETMNGEESHSKGTSTKRKYKSRKDKTKIKRIKLALPSSLLNSSLNQDVPVSLRPQIYAKMENIIFGMQYAHEAKERIQYNIPTHHEKSLPMDVREAIVYSMLSRPGGLIIHQFEAFYHFLHYNLVDIIAETTFIREDCPHAGVYHTIQLFGDIEISPPVIHETNGSIRYWVTPQECKIRKLTYASDIRVSLRHEMRSLSTNELLRQIELPRYTLFVQPIMVGSKYCTLQNKPFHLDENPLDSKGYFIISGISKTVITQENRRSNFPFVFHGKSKNEWICEVRSLADHKIRSTSTLKMKYFINSHYLDVSVPFSIGLFPFLYYGVFSVSLLIKKQWTRFLFMKRIHPFFVNGFTN